MRKKQFEHIVSILFVTVTLIFVYNLLPSNKQLDKEADANVAKYYNSNLVDFSDSYQKNLFQDVLNVYYPNDKEKNQQIVYEIDELRIRKFTDPNAKTGIVDKGLTWGKITSILNMYLFFLFVYIIVMIVIHYLAQSFAIIRFVKIKQGRKSYLNETISYFAEYAKKENPKNQKTESLKRAGYSFIKGVGKTVGYIMLFSPAYVVAYSFKTSFSTDSLPFMILLAVMTNGLLINYAYKFYSLLVAESKSGYVETAIVKGLDNNYNTPQFAYKNIFKFNKKFSNHIFQHIYLNAKYKNTLNIKELSALLITGLIIIEMALNIQGYICYELLQNVLFKQYDVVIFIVLLLFVTVKLMEMFVDYWYYHYSRRYENKD